MEYARSTYDETDSWLASQVAVSGRGVGGGLFVAEGDKSNTELETFFGDLDYGNADETEDDADSEVMEGEGDLLCAGELCGRHYVNVYVQDG